MSQGEVHQLIRKGDISLSEEEYLDVIKRKTALLFQAACRVSAILADAPADQQDALSDYGYNLGIAFQMADDLFDYILETEDLGKGIGADLKEGKMTLPVIYALKQAQPGDRDQMIDIIKNEDFSHEDFKKLIRLMDSHGGLEYTNNKAADHIRTAKDALAVFTSSKTKDTLLDIADYALARRV
jgi:octaprenyl-diphosphate synthase